VISNASSADLADVRAIMMAFAERTGLEPAATAERRYLWTDAFAVCNFLSLHEATGDDSYLAIATRLIDRVHHTLGRHRPDDARSGWISGLSDEDGERHPTVGGLRIGKRLAERGAGVAQDERQEWDRDGQYFHYLTKWMHALERTAVMTSDATFCRWALELAQIAHSAFVYTAMDGTRRMVWKLSIDLSRHQVSSMGHHDPLDALVSYSELDHCRAAHFAAAQLPSLQSQIAEARSLCAGRNWLTEDPLGIGGLLFDICRLSQLQAQGATIPAATLSQLLVDASSGLEFAASRYSFRAPAQHRLAFRELGLAIGLRAVEMLKEDARAGWSSVGHESEAKIEALLQFSSLGEAIVAFWRNPANQTNPTWDEHVDINAVMLATSLLPRQFLMI